MLEFTEVAQYVEEKRKKQQAGIVNECGLHNEKGGDSNPVSFVSLHWRFNLEVRNAAKGLLCDTISYVLSCFVELQGRNVNTRGEFRKVLFLKEYNF